MDQSSKLFNQFSEVEIGDFCLSIMQPTQYLCFLIINWYGGMTRALCSEYLYPESELWSTESECHHHYETLWRFSQRSRLGYDTMINNKPPTMNKNQISHFVPTTKISRVVSTKGFYRIAKHRKHFLRQFKMHFRASCGIQFHQSILISICLIVSRQD